MQKKVNKTLEKMDAIISESSLEDESLKDTPWIQNKQEVPSIEQYVSLHVIDSYMNAYQFNTGNSDDLSPTDFLVLLEDQTSDDALSESYSNFISWVLDNGRSKYDIYWNGSRAAYSAFEILEGKSYQDKAPADLTAEDEQQLALWAIDHPEAKDKLEAKDSDHYQNLLDFHHSKEDKWNN